MSNKNTLAIYLIGPTPPPVGGVASHVRRLLFFASSRGRDAVVFDVSQHPKETEKIIDIHPIWLVKLFLKKTGIIHLHVINFNFLLFILSLSLKHKTILSFQNERYPKKMELAKGLRRWFYKLVLKRINQIIVTNNNSEDSLKTLVKPHSKIHIVPPFIPPEDSSSPVDEEILELRQRFPILISSYVYRYSFYKDEDLYGVDLLIELAKLLNEKRVDFCIVLRAPEATNPYSLELEARIRQYNISSRFFFIKREVNAPSLWKTSDIFIRATNTDGNSVSVMEALSLGTPVIASDCVERPEGTIIFKNRDLKDLTQKTEMALKDLKYYKEDLKNYSYSNYAEELMRVYESLD